MAPVARIRPLLVPLGVSLLVHLTLLLVIAGIVFDRGPRSRTSARVVVSLSEPQPAPEPTQNRPDRPAPKTAAPAPGPVRARTAHEPVPVEPILVQRSARGSTPSIPSRRAAATPRPRSMRRFIGETTFAGTKVRRASRVVYAVDASGSMVTSLSLVLGELVRSVQALSPDQRFQVVIFRDRSLADPGAAPYQTLGGRSAGLLPATTRNTAALAAWVQSIQPAGRSNPLDGLDAALALDPDVVFLLARGFRRSGPSDEQGAWGAGRERVLQELDRLNPPSPRTGRRPVVIKTIQFLDDDPTGVMQAIAAVHGDGPGSYHVLTLDQLNPP